MRGWCKRRPRFCRSDDPIEALFSPSVTVGFYRGCCFEGMHNRLCSDLDQRDGEWTRLSCVQVLHWLE